MTTTAPTGFTSSTSWARWLFCLATLCLHCLWTKLVVCPCWVRIEATDKLHSQIHSSNCFFFLYWLWDVEVIYVMDPSLFMCLPSIMVEESRYWFCPVIHLNIIQPTVTYSNPGCCYSCAPIRWLNGAFRHQLLLPVVWHQRVHDDFHVVPLQRPEHLCLELPGCGHDRVVPHC